MASQILSSSSSSRIEVLRQKHAVLSTTIEKTQFLPSTKDHDLSQLKKRKLALKQEIQDMQRVQAG